MDAHGIFLNLKQHNQLTHIFRSLRTWTIFMGTSQAKVRSRKINSECRSQGPYTKLGFLLGIPLVNNVRYQYL